MAERNTCNLRVTYEDDGAVSLVQNYISSQNLDWSCEDITKGVLRIIAPLATVTPAHINGLRQLSGVRDVELSYTTV